MMDKLELLTKLIAFDTTSRNSNRALIDFIQDYLQGYGISSHLTISSCGHKANLLATLPALGGVTQGGLVLSGHTDVVPVDNQNWSYPPFTATIANGRVYGRGSCDMKGFIAVVLGLIPQVATQKLTRPLHLAFSYDEEVGCCGAVDLIDDIIAQGLQPEYCLVGEPSSMEVITAHKGINNYRIQVFGKACHSSLTNQGCNAIEYAAEIIVKLRALANQLRLTGANDPDYDVPYSTLSTNLINGGIATNIIPEFCEVYFELRNLPQIDHQQILQPLTDFIEQDLLPRMRGEFADARIEISQTAQVPGLTDQYNHDLAAIVRQIVASYTVKKVAYATEGGMFQNARIPTVICGPGSITEAHRPDEFVTLTQLELCHEVLIKLINEVLI